MTASATNPPARKTWPLRRSATLLAPGVALAAVLGAFVRAAPQEYRIVGDHVAVYNLAGEVSVVAGSGDDVVVTLEPGGADADRLEVESGAIRGRQTLRVRYPSDRIVYGGMGRASRTRIRVREDGTFGDGASPRGETVDVRGSGRGLEAWADMTLAVPPGQKLSLHLGVGEIDVRNVDGDLEIDVGSGAVASTSTTGSLDIDTGSGAVTVTGADGPLRVDTGSGSVTLEDVAGARVGIDTGSGGVRASGVRSEYVEVDTGSGRVSLLDVAAPNILVDTGSGSVELDLAADVDRLEVDTGSGGVTLRVPGDLGARIEADTGSGTIDVGVPVDERTRRRTYLRGTIGDGRGAIALDSGSGSIRILAR